MIQFLIILGLLWILFAVIQDFKMREVANWINFSLIVFALVARFFYSLFTNDWSFIVFGFFGFGVFFVLAHGFYYSRLFAGGDAKLMIALGAVIPIAGTYYENVLIFFVFIIALFLFGALYSLIYSFILSFVNWKSFAKEFKKKFYLHRFYFYVSLIFALAFLVLSFIQDMILMIPALIISVLPYLYVYLKAVEKSALFKRIDVEKLTVGDWVVGKIKVERKTVEPNWEGLSEKDLKLLQKNYKKKVLVKYGIPFTPAFLFAFLTIIVLWIYGGDWGLWGVFG